MNQSNTVNVVNVANEIASIIGDNKARNSIKYAKCRSLIEVHSKSRAEKRLAKMAVIEVLHGQVIHPKLQPHQRSPLPNYVQFDDSTKARF